jgi:hypothetical protein
MTNQPQFLNVPAGEVRVGDDLDYLGKPYRITRIEEYAHPVVTKGETWWIAYADTREKFGKNAWGMTLGKGTRYDVIRAPEPVKA